jgi:hypothetical protein
MQNSNKTYIIREKQSATLNTSGCIASQEGKNKNTYHEQHSRKKE